MFKDIIMYVRQTKTCCLCMHIYFCNQIYDKQTRNCFICSLYSFYAKCGIKIDSECIFDTKPLLEPMLIVNRILKNKRQLNLIKNISLFLCAPSWSALFWMYIPPTSPIARFLGSTWGPSGADRTQVGPMLAPWPLLSGIALLEER